MTTEQHREILFSTEHDEASLQRSASLMIRLLAIIEGSGSRNTASALLVGNLYTGGLVSTDRNKAAKRPDAILGIEV